MIDFQIDCFNENFSVTCGHNRSYDKHEISVVVNACHMLWINVSEQKDFVRKRKELEKNSHNNMWNHF